MALQPPAIYHKMQKMFTMYEEGKLKDQKKRMMTGSTLQMAIEGKLAPKLHQFKVFQGLKVSHIIYSYNYNIVMFLHHNNIGCRQGEDAG